MDKKELKLIMTQVAKGEISEKEAELLIKPEKTAQKEPVQEIEGKNTHKRKKSNKSGRKNK